MQNLKVIDFTQYRDDDDRRPKRKRSKKRLKGSVYGRNGKLWVDFRYLGERVREPSGLADTPLNRKAVRKQLNLITAEIDNGLFEFAERFPIQAEKPISQSLREIGLKESRMKSFFRIMLKGGFHE
jgi:hypothetical protein